MKLEGQYQVAAPQTNVWTVLQDPTFLARILPGCEKLEQIGENKYTAAVKIQVGPMQGTFTGVITLSDIVVPSSYRMDFDGKGTLGFVKGQGTVNLTEQNSGTHVQYSGEATIGGRIAAVGQRLMESSARALIEQTFDLMTPIAQSLTPPAVSSDSGASPQRPSTSTINLDAAPMAVRRPSQMEFGMGILKHMYEDTVPEPYRAPVLIVLGLAVLFVLNSLLNAIFRR